MKGILKKASILLSLLLVFAFVAPFVLGAGNISVEKSTSESNCFDAGICLLEEETGRTIEGTVNVTNIGDSDTLTIKFDFLETDFTDTNGKKIDISFNPATLTLSPGKSSTVTIKAIIPDNIILKTYAGEVTARNITNPEHNNDKFTLQIDIRPSKVDDICKNGRRGNVKIGYIDKPDNDEEFKPGEQIKIDVDVNNNDDDSMKIELTAFLIDKKKDEVLNKDSDYIKIKGDDSDNFKFNLKVPYDIEESSSRYAVYIVAYEKGNGDDNCDWEKKDIEINKESDYIVATDVNPAELTCGQVNDVTVDIVNAGNNDQDEVEVRFSILNISQKKTINNFDEGDDSNVLFSFDLPKDTEAGTHNIEIIILDEDGYESTRKFFPVNIICEAPKPSATLSLMQSSFVARQGSSISTTAVIINTGDADETFTLKVTPIGTWSDAIENTFTLAKGETKSVPLSLPVKQEGSHSAKVEVLADDKVLTTQTISVSATSIETMPVTAGVVGVAKEQMALFIIISVLALAVIVLIIWLIFLYAKKGSVASISSGSKELRRVKEAVRGKSRRR